MHINDLLKVAVTSGSSDLHLKVGSYPMMRAKRPAIGGGGAPEITRFGG